MANAPEPKRRSLFGSLRILRFRRLDLSPTRRRLRQGVSVADLRPIARPDMSEVDISTTLLGKPLSFSLVLGPTGFTRIAHPARELAQARAAARARIPYALSTLGTRSIEEVAGADGSGSLWFQVYTRKDRGLTS